jgi:hypothetical protein
MNGEETVDPVIKIVERGSKKKEKHKMKLKILCSHQQIGKYLALLCCMLPWETCGTTGQTEEQLILLDLS